MQHNNKGCLVWAWERTTFLRVLMHSYLTLSHKSALYGNRQESPSQTCLRLIADVSPGRTQIHVAIDVHDAHVCDSDKISHGMYVKYFPRILAIFLRLWHVGPNDTAFRTLHGAFTGSPETYIASAVLGPVLHMYMYTQSPVSITAPGIASNSNNIAKTNWTTEIQY